jgi:predicted PurR-regulated permease PerM
MGSIKRTHSLTQDQLVKQLDQRLRSIRVALLGIFLILFMGFIYLARDFLLPVVIAFLLALTLSPIVRFLQKRGVAPPFSALVIVVIVISVFSAGSFLLSGPITQWIDSTPEISRRIQEKLAAVSFPFDAIFKASAQVESMGESVSASDVQKVVIQQPGRLLMAAASIKGGLTTVAITCVLLLFLLASGTMFYEKMIGILPTLEDKKRALSIAHDVERDVSHYLLTITLINAGLGTSVAIAMALTGMPNPVLWGVAAALLNFVPYVGAIGGILMVGMVALISFDSIGYAAIPPLLYAAFSIIEGQFVTPIFLGRRLELNSVAIFMCVALWGWLWGIVGAIIAVPLLVTVKVFCDHFDRLNSFGEFLSGQPSTIRAEASKDAGTTLRGGELVDGSRKHV